MRLIAFDPSTTSTGWAVTDDKGKILKYGRIRPKSKSYRRRTFEMGRTASSLVLGNQADIVLIEEPDDQGMVGRTTGTQRKLAAVSYYVAGSLLSYPRLTVIMVPVQKWKGTVPKDVVYRRLLRIYGPALPKGTTQNPWNHDAIDAVGIINWYLNNGRLQDNDEFTC